MRTIKLTGTTDAGGDATVNSSEGPAQGLLRGVQVNLSALDATADTTISFQSADDEAITVLTLTNSQVDDYFVPSPSAHDETGSAITNSFPPFAVTGIPRVVVAQGGATNAFAVVLYIERVA